MTQLPIDYVIYKNTREWMRLRGITIDPADAKELTVEDIANKASFVLPILIHGQRDNHPYIAVVVPTSNSFSKGPDVEKVMKGIPSDGKTNVLIVSTNIASQLAEYPWIRSVTHKIMMYNPARHTTGPKSAEIIRKSDSRIETEVKWDCITNTIRVLSQIHANDDPLIFWLDGRPGDVLRLICHAEDTYVTSQYLVIV
jgi:hypothetical protein